MENQTLKLKLKDRAGDCQVHLSDGTPLGNVQAVTVTARVGERTKAVVETVCTEAEVEILQQNTEVNIKIQDMDAYGKGYKVVSEGAEPVEYEPLSYAAYLYDKGREQAFEDRFEQHMQDFEDAMVLSLAVINNLNKQ